MAYVVETDPDRLASARKRSDRGEWRYDIITPWGIRPARVVKVQADPPRVWLEAAEVH